MSRTHAVVWLDQREANIFEFGDDELHRKSIRADAPFRRVRRPAGAANGEASYFDDILKTVASATDWAIMGPSPVAREFGKYVERHQPRLGRRLVGVESMARPADPELQARVAKLFATTKRPVREDDVAARLPRPPLSHSGPIRLDRL
jgi:hypothetical protein